MLGRLLRILKRQLTISFTVGSRHKFLTQTGKAANQQSTQQKSFCAAIFQSIRWIFRCAHVTIIGCCCATGRKTPRHYLMRQLFLKRCRSSKDMMRHWKCTSFDLSLPELQTTNQPNVYLLPNKDGTLRRIQMRAIYFTLCVPEQY